MNFKSNIFLVLLILSGLACFSQNSPIEFIENKGQWDSRVSFMGLAGTGAFYVQRDGFTIVQTNPADLEKLHNLVHLHKSDGKQLSPGTEMSIHNHAYKVSFVNPNPKLVMTPDKALPTINNYFIGNDPSKWASGCRIFQGITISNVYPNVDVRYYSDRGQVKYDLIIKPGGKVSDIALRYEGADKLEIKNRELHVKTSVGDVRELAPYTFQYHEKGKVDVPAKYSLKDNIVRFNVPDYDPSTTLIIDPSLVFSTFSGSTSDNWGFTATFGPDGSMYGGGIVFGPNFPVSTGAYQTTFSGGSNSGFGAGFDIGIIKLTPNGSNRVYATYLGGTGNDFPQSLIVNPQGELVVAGRSDSPDYPVKGDTAGLSNNKFFDITVTKLDANGILNGSLKIGGDKDDGANISPYGTGASSLQQNYGDEARSEVNLDAAGNIYLASCTQSDNFPIRGGFQSTNAGGQDGIVLKINAANTSLIFSSYLGGGGNDAAYVLTVNPFDNNIYVAGGTESDNLPGSKAGVVQSKFGGVIDGFISVISNNGSSIIKTTYLGTSAIDQIYGLQFDKFGFPYVMGQTTGSWTVVNAGFSQPNGRQFISKLKPDLSGYVYSTTIGKGGNAPDFSPVAFVVDRCENVYISGWGGVVNSAYPSAGVDGLFASSDAIKPAPDKDPQGRGSDFYFFVLKRDATAPLYGTFFGQNGGLTDHVDGGTSRFDKNGVIYQAICANCGKGVPFPTTPGSWSPTNKTPAGAGAQCNLAMVKISFNLAGVQGAVQSAIEGKLRDTRGCIPLTVDFRDTIQIATSYDWNFNDGSPVVHTVAPQISHTFTSVGVYKVMMIAIDSSACNIRDTSYITITAGDQKAALDFTANKLNPCNQFRYRFDNLTKGPLPLPFADTSFIWDFGDNTPMITTGTAPAFHEFASPGTYTVKLILNDSRFCNYPDTLIKQIRVAALVKAAFETPLTGCIPYNAKFSNTSSGGDTFNWNFGDGTTSNAVEPTHLYAVPGTYKVTLIAIDSATCNIIDSTSATISVYGIPTAAFTASPQPPIKNTPITFTNNSSADAVRFKWDFGDGDSLITTSSANIQHEYNATGNFNTCLTAYNIAGCSATACNQVTTFVMPAVDVPNAFTPLSGNINSVVYVRGYGIAKMKFTIWARWGEKVFETSDRKIGWNGIFKGKLLPMDVYAYTLDVQFSDGTKTTKKGDITLIR